MTFLPSSSCSSDVDLILYVSLKDDGGKKGLAQGVSSRVCCWWDIYWFTYLFIFLNSIHWGKTQQLNSKQNIPHSWKKGRSWHPHSTFGTIPFTLVVTLILILWFLYWDIQTVQLKLSPVFQVFIHIILISSLGFHFLDFLDVHPVIKRTFAFVMMALPRLCIPLGILVTACKVSDILPTPRPPEFPPPPPSHRFISLVVHSLRT